LQAVHRSGARLELTHIQHDKARDELGYENDYDRWDKRAHPVRSEDIGEDETEEDRDHERRGRHGSADPEARPAS
jgi:hypothetical protein